MFEELSKFLSTLNTLTPLGVIALLGTTIFLLVHKNGPIQTIKNNHLEHVQASLDKIVELNEKQVEHLVDIKTDISFVKGKID